MIQVTAYTAFLVKTLSGTTLPILTLHLWESVLNNGSGLGNSYDIIPGDGCAIESSLYGTIGG
jgi:hypothetical protein